MSEEEIINILSDEIVSLNVGHEKYKQAVKGLLDLYQKEKEKNKRFFNGEIFTKNQIEIVQKAVKEGIEEQVPKEMKNFISKNKIKELSNKYENEIDKTGFLVRLNQFNLLRVVINDLDELLEE